MPYEGYTSLHFLQRRQKSLVRALRNWSDALYWFYLSDYLMEICMRVHFVMISSVLCWGYFVPRYIRDKNVYTFKYNEGNLSYEIKIKISRFHVFFPPAYKEKKKDKFRSSWEKTKWGERHKEALVKHNKCCNYFFLCYVIQHKSPSLFKTTAWQLRNIWRQMILC